MSLKNLIQLGFNTNHKWLKSRRNLWCEGANRRENLRLDEPSRTQSLIWVYTCLNHAKWVRVRLCMSLWIITCAITVRIVGRRINSNMFISA
ncbi:unnamed protein product [Moneuplotes crassus]|uniref:Uncharacterized protein n=1 Tax=Euplotes crassus TaxID=5936 RepID=A0AAD1UB47_EUPCR|nr:unnamed protein product [Moneuplotes crassus]